MKRYSYIMTLSILTLHAIAIAKKPYKAVVIQPIADAIGSSIQTFFPFTSPEKGYAQLPVSGGQPLASSCCPRLHQLLFNEMGTVLKEEGEEVLIKITNCFYTTHSNHAPQHAYWTLKKNILPLKELKTHRIDTKLFPPPISFYDPSSITNKDVITLSKPWYDQTTDQTYSAGTRFLKSNQEIDESQSIQVHIFNTQKNEFTQALIPASFYIESPSNTQQKIDLFITILKKWAHPENGFIPYVWGGCSFTATATQPFSEEKKTNASCSSYTIKDFTHIPKPGFDCSNLILRAAQAAGIPYFFKNSHTVTAHLKQVHEDQQLQAGDIIWIPGHVLIVADTNKKTVIEARGYKYKGQGKIQEIELKKVFKGINSCDDLVSAWRAKKPIERIGYDGSTIETIKHMKLLSMRSILE